MHVPLPIIRTVDDAETLLTLVETTRLVLHENWYAIKCNIYRMCVIVRFVVSMTWWKRFVTAVEEKNIDKILRVGIIDNSDIMEEDLHDYVPLPAANKKFKLRPNLTERKEFVLVPESVMIPLLVTYDCHTYAWIRRTVVQNFLRPYPHIEVYPIIIKWRTIFNFMVNETKVEPFVSAGQFTDKLYGLASSGIRKEITKLYVDREDAKKYIEIDENLFTNITRDDILVVEWNPDPVYRGLFGPAPKKATLPGPELSQIPLQTTLCNVM
uniref:DUSP domain-containing protein n=1 Tax=Steinernema glaseri TaxID=37863 RepID=A0A1I7Z4K4_9BILA